MYLPSKALRTILAVFTSPVPVSVNKGIDLTSAVISALVLYVPPAPSSSYHVTVNEE